MSIVIQMFPQCDICGETNPDMLRTSKKEVKEDMKREGWIRRKGKDICCECQYKKGASTYD